MKLDFEKGNGLIPVVIQDSETLQVLMLGYMNGEALDKTQKTGKVTFFSRSKKRLWTKGESSGNELIVKTILPDCDKDALLIMAEPKGPVCHRNTTSCFDNDEFQHFIFELEKIIELRKSSDSEKSYTKSLFESGIAKIAQKVGEEAVETVIEAMKEDADAFDNEVADLLFHLLVLIKAKNKSLNDIQSVLANRHNAH
jgi:phosphoribosyl-ATP pyrophosphohydrolase/phosphoribosyl-AMP cyclohydrolase